MHHAQDEGARRPRRSHGRDAQAPHRLPIRQADVLPGFRCRQDLLRRRAEVGRAGDPQGRRLRPLERRGGLQAGLFLGLQAQPDRGLHLHNGTDRPQVRRQSVHRYRREVLRLVVPVQEGHPQGSAGEENLIMRRLTGFRNVIGKPLMTIAQERQTAIRG